MNQDSRKRGAPSDELSESEKMAEAEKTKKITEQYRQLLREVQLNPEKINTDTAYRESVLKAMDDIFPEWNVTEGETMAACTYSLMDAKIIRKLMTSFLKDAEDGMIKFNVGEFADNLAINGMDATLDDEGKLGLKSKNWIAFGLSNSPLFKQFAGLRYLFGALDKVDSVGQSAPTECIKKPRAKTPKHLQEEIVETRLKTLNMHEKEDKDVSIDKTVEEVFQILSRECRRIGGNISLLEFTLHPKSYTESIRNLFYLSYLVKERRVVLQICDGIPFIRPKNLVPSHNVRTTDTEENFEAHQVIFSINYEQYEQLIEVLEIESPMITLSS